MVDDLEFEKSFWGDCCNTYSEETKQYVYARLMGLTQVHTSIDVEGKKILDIGGGPVSLLLKTYNLRAGKVVDPLDYPEWTKHRYAARGVEVVVGKGEDIDETGWDEVWIYNCLQHTEDPGKIIRNAKKAAGTLRIFEWIDIPAHEGHPHELTEESLNGWICAREQKGFTTYLSENGCFGKAYYGTFHFESHALPLESV